ncbi:MAG TPA: BamA/TamA family outer membrane protein [Opitutaceae bacterium]|nr:BamA/TamA family outer membrane protein [Opitutaceae bacterium]
MPRSDRRGGGRWLAGALAALVLGSAPARAAEWRIRGLGWLDNRKTGQALQLLLGAQQGPTVGAAAIEDASVILFSQLAEDGYLDAQVRARLTLADGTAAEFPLDAKLDHPLPRSVRARAVTLQVRVGPRFTLREVAFDGLHSIAPAEARAYFVGESPLIPLAAERIYSPNRLQRALGNLQEALRRQGRAEAAVTLENADIDRATGRVRIRVRVEEGPAWRVAALKFAIADGSPPPPETVGPPVGRLWNDLWREDTAAAIRRWYYERGHPDVQTSLAAVPAPPVGGERAVTVTARVVPGPAVRLGRVRFTGNERTRTSVLRRAVRAAPGAPLNPIQLDDGLTRLARLGVFSNLTLQYDPPAGPTRDAVYHLTEGRREEVDLLAGYGSYDEERGGVEWRHDNLFGLAHTNDLKVIQSVKSTQLNDTYTVPELFGTSVDGSAQLLGLRRQELSFVRTEYGANVALLWPVPWLGANLSTGYTFKRLRATSNELATSPTDLNQANAASIDLGLTRDTRDDPLQPHHGHKLYLDLTEASHHLGGQVDYQRLVVGASYHWPWGGGRWLHAGFSHGVVTTWGAPNDSELPVNVRFFPGGEDSIRGYRSGEAASRDATGQFLGVKAYTQLNLELEQALTAKWSVVAFTDALGTAVKLADYPFNQRLYAVGLGVNYRTLIGPVRLEYGRNLNPRPFDPSGRLLLSIGFPF